MTPFQTSYYNFWTRWVKADRFMRVFDIDFQKPFWSYLLEMKFHICMCLIQMGCTYLFNPIFIIFITKAILDRDLEFFITLSVVKVLQHIVILPFGRSYVYLYDGIQCSFRSTVQKQLIQIDPIEYATKSTGEILTKVERTVNGIHTFVATLFETMIPFVISLGVAVWIVAQADLKLGVLMAIVFVILCGCNILIVNFNNSVFLPKINKLEEVEKQYLVENITQNSYIRSTFATPEQLAGGLKATFASSTYTATKWRTWQYLVIMLEMVIISIILTIVGFQLLNLAVAPYILVGMFTSLYAIYQKFYEIGLIADDFSKSIHNKKKFWQFMRTFGKQTFPVIEGSAAVAK